jgi:hypothetical protein
VWFGSRFLAQSGWFATVNRMPGVPRGPLTGDIPAVTPHVRINCTPALAAAMRSRIKLWASDSF